MIESDWKRIGKELQRRREDAGITQRQAAATVGVHWQTIGAIERGRGGTAQTATLARFAALLNYPLANALAGEAVAS